MKGNSNPELIKHCGMDLRQQAALSQKRGASRVVYQLWLRSAEVACGIKPKCSANSLSGWAQRSGSGVKTKTTDN